MDAPDDAPRWGFMTNRWHDQPRTAHLLLPNNAPACGASFYASAGMSQDVQDYNKCRNCLRIANASKRRKGKVS
jgi:hypothetical protein